MKRNPGTLKIHESQVGKRDPAVAQCLNNLALLLHAQGQYAEAGSLLRRALAICDTRLGEYHPHTVTIQENLKILLDQMRQSKS